MENQADKNLWRLEVKSPLAPIVWQRLWGFNEDQLTAFQGLRDELNRINDPVQLRIVPNSDEEEIQDALQGGFQADGN
jgi:hypothetical protein